MENLIKNHLEIENLDAISDKQFGFRKEKSTISAINKVVNMAKATRSSTRDTRRHCVLVIIVRELKKYDIPFADKNDNELF